MTDVLHHLPDWADVERWNEYQQPVFDEVMARFDEGNRMVVLDAPPGSGKSLLGYMVHRSLKASAYYLVGTKHLQLQAQRLPGVKVIKGRANYIPTDVPYELERFNPTTADCDKDQSDICTYCSNVDACPYVVARDEAELSQLPCANYAYALGEWSGHRSKFRHRELVICDECDTLADELRNFVSVSVTQKWQRIIGLRPPEKKTVESAWPEWFDYALPKMEAFLHRMPKRTVYDMRDAATLERTIGKMRAITLDFEGWVYDYDTKKDLDEQPIKFKPVTVDKLANNVLWNKGARFLCMSASVGSPEQFVKDLGFTDSWAPVFAASTFPVERRPIHVMPAAYMVSKKAAAEWPKVARALEATLNMFEDLRTLVLPHTYPITRYLMNHLEDRVQRPLFAYLNADEREEVIAKFEACEDSLAPVLLASSLGRGYDNASLGLVVICKVPYPDLGSKQVSKRQRMGDGNMWYANETAKSIIQATGRAMRSEDDEGTTIILDAMFSKFYGQWERLFPQHLRDAVHWDGEVQFYLRRAMKTISVSS